MLILNNILYLETREMELATISPNTIGAWEAPVKIKHPNDKRVSLFAYELLKDKYKQLVQIKFGNPYEYQSASFLREHLCYDSKALIFFQEHRTASGKFLPRHKDEKKDYPQMLAKAASWLNLFIAITEKSLPLSKEQYAALRANNYQVFRTALEKEGVKFLSKSYNKLMVDKREYVKHGYCYLIPNNLENQNSKKIKGDNEILLKQIFAQHNNLDAQAVAVRMNLYLNKVGATHKNGKPLKITNDTVRANMKPHLLQLQGPREGYKDWSNTYRPMVRRDRSSFPLAMVAHDGWDVELYYQKEVEGKTTCWNRKVAVIVIDTFNDYPLGFAIGDSETGNLIAEAYRNAIFHIRQLTGEYNLPWQLKGDNFGGNMVKDLYAKIANGADYVTPIKVGNSQDNPVESFFSRLNTKHCQPQYNWSGRGMESRKETQANREYLLKIKDQFPSEQEVIVQIMLMIEEVRNEKREQWIKAWNEVGAEERRPISREKMLEDFGIERERTIKITNQGLAPEINGVGYQFALLDHDFYQYIGSDFTIKYDPYDMDNVLAVCNQHRVQFMVPALDRIPMAFKDQREGDRTMLNRMLSFRKEVEQNVINKNAKEYDFALAMVQSTGDAETMMKIMPTVAGQQKHLMKKAEAIMKGIQQPVYAELPVAKTGTDDAADIYSMM